MMKKIEKIISSDVFFVIVLSIVAYVIMYHMQIHAGDDLVLKDSLRNMSWLNWSNSLYNEWTGRTIVISVIVFLLNINIFWVIIANAIMYVLLGYGILKLCSAKNNDNKYKFLIEIAIILLLLYIPLTITSSSIFWITGSVNYLWPAALLIWSIIPFKKIICQEQVTIADYIIAGLASILACNAEQAGLIVIVLGIIALITDIVRNKKINTRLLIYVSICLAFSLYSIFAPGNAVRAKAEMLMWMPNFNMKSYLDQFFLGISHVYEHSFNDMLKFYLLLSILLAYLLKNKNMLMKIFSWLVVLFFALAYITLKFGGMSPVLYSISQMFFNYNIDFSKFYLLSTYLPFISASVIYISIAYMIYETIDDKKLAVVIVLLYFASICSSLILGFTPTIYVSGHRIYFIGDVLLIVTIIFVFKEFIKCFTMKWIFNVFYFLAIILIVHQCYLYFTEWSALLIY